MGRINCVKAILLRSGKLVMATVENYWGSYFWEGSLMHRYVQKQLSSKQEFIVMFLQYTNCKKSQYLRTI